MCRCLCPSGRGRKRAYKRRWRPVAHETGDRGERRLCAAVQIDDDLAASGSMAAVARSPLQVSQSAIEDNHLKRPQRHTGSTAQN